MIVGVRCLLLQAGVPECFWSLAISYWTLCYNVSSNKGLPDAVSPMTAKYPEFELTAVLIPFGHAITFNPHPKQASSEPHSKWASRSQEGVCLGMSTYSNGQPDGAYLVCDVESIVSFIAGKNHCLEGFAYC